MFFISFFFFFTFLLCFKERKNKIHHLFFLYLKVWPVYFFYFTNLCSLWEICSYGNKARREAWHWWVNAGTWQLMTTLFSSGTGRRKLYVILLCYFSPYITCFGLSQMCSCLIKPVQCAQVQNYLQSLTGYVFY